jgi:hypothetical protein
MFDFSPAPVDNQIVFYAQAANGEFEKNCQQSHFSCDYPRRNPFTSNPVYCQRDSYFTRTGCTNIPSLSTGDILSMRLTAARN